MERASLHVLYDANCRFCRWCTGVILRADRAQVVVPATIQSEEGQALLGSIPFERRLDSVSAVGADGVVHSGGDALVAIAEVLPGGRLPARLLIALGPVTRHGYHLVASNRIRISRAVPLAAKDRADELIAARRRALGLSDEPV